MSAPQWPDEYHRRGPWSGPPTGLHVSTFNHLPFAMSQIAQRRPARQGEPGNNSPPGEDLPETMRPGRVVARLLPAATSDRRLATGVGPWPCASGRARQRRNPHAKARRYGPDRTASRRRHGCARGPRRPHTRGYTGSIRVGVSRSSWGCSFIASGEVPVDNFGDNWGWIGPVPSRVHENVASREKPTKNCRIAVS